VVSVGHDVCVFRPRQGERSQACSPAQCDLAGQETLAFFHRTRGWPMPKHRSDGERKSVSCGGVKAASRASGSAPGAADLHADVKTRPSEHWRRRGRGRGSAANADPVNATAVAAAKMNLLLIPRAATKTIIDKGDAIRERRPVITGYFVVCVMIAGAVMSSAYGCGSKCLWP
jgi:hypothetical protein